MNKKDLKISNAKGLLIFMVVFGHLLEINKEQFYDIYVFIYAIHMPLFIFISGYLAKRISIGKIINVVLIYLIIQSLFSLFLTTIDNLEYFRFQFVMPHFHLWYLVSIAIWYLIALLLNSLKLSNVLKVAVFIVIFFISFISRYYTDLITFYLDISSYTLSYQRTLTFAPFFFAGFFLNKVKMQRLNQLLPYRKLIGITVFILAFLVIVNLPINMEELFRGSRGSSTFIESKNSYIITVLIHYFLSFSLCFIILNLVSQKTNVITRWGDHSLPIFLFHPIVYYLLVMVEILQNDNIFLIKFLFYFLLAIVSCSILSSKYFIRWTWYFFNPLKYLYRLKNKLTN